ncbi:unnamed protein product [Cuscuta epithymum]|uniref:Pectate lyase n=1 Tax=Cuscuta epithymum TaxID=186058 RepID=A0AAV0DNA0_9ASTE|nr:unnamed protein product [Cuscuta epithymum]
MATHSVVGALVIIIMIMHLFLTTKVISTSNKNNNNASTTTNMNVIDSCWRRSKSSWASNRRALADCAVGFGKYATGGKNGATYVVTHSSDNPRNPKPGTLSYKTIDGRGAKVEISNGPCITIQGVTNIIVHGIIIQDCKQGKSGQEVRDSPTHAGRRGGSDGDAITIFGSSNVWIDHCFLARAADGLIDVIHGSTNITISNNYFTQHDKVMLFGHNDDNIEDKSMKVTVAFNHFGPGLVERMPRVRLGYAHVANNRYSGWLMYAIGGSANPIIFSEGNYFMAPNKSDSKQI